MSSFAVVVARDEREARWLERTRDAERTCTTWDDKPVLVVTLDAVDGHFVHRFSAKLAGTPEDARELAEKLYG